MNAVLEAKEYIESKYNIELLFKKKLYNYEITEKLTEITGRQHYYETDKSFISPDGGYLYIKDKYNKDRMLLIGEVKNQGTNNLRIRQGLKKQSKGNAIERLGKNVIALREYQKYDGIFPFCCFGYGEDFEEGSTIRDRVYSIACYKKLNTVNLETGSFFFRKTEWTQEEMRDTFIEIIEKSLDFYEIMIDNEIKK